MIKIEKESLPEEYERAIIEEYYNLYRSREGFPISLIQTVRYTSDLSRLRKRDLRNEDLMKAINAYESINNDNIEFICYGPKDIITTIARIMISSDNIHIIDILFLNYPNLREKKCYIKHLIDIANDYGYANGCETISCSVDKGDNAISEIITNLGFILTPENEKEASNYPTYIMERDIIKKDEQTRRRQQK